MAELTKIEIAKSIADNKFIVDMKAFNAACVNIGRYIVRNELNADNALACARMQFGPRLEWKGQWTESEKQNAIRVLSLNLLSQLS